MEAERDFRREADLSKGNSNELSVLSTFKKFITPPVHILCEQNHCADANWVNNTETFPRSFKCFRSNHHTYSARCYIKNEYSRPKKRCHIFDSQHYKHFYEADRCQSYVRITTVYSKKFTYAEKKGKKNIPHKIIRESDFSRIPSFHHNINANVYKSLCIVLPALYIVCISFYFILLNERERMRTIPHFQFEIWRV